MEFNSYQVDGLTRGEKPGPGRSPRRSSISVNLDLLPHIRVSTWEGNGAVAGNCCYSKSVDM